MEHQRIEIALKSPVRSLCWHGDSLVDWASGGTVMHLSGEVERRHAPWACNFDAAVRSPSGRYAVAYERLGTKGVLLDDGNVVHELKRSDYRAGTYEYPVVLFQRADGCELMAHCPDEYNRIEIDDIATGARLTGKVDRKPRDFFHSRLAVSPDGERLLSAGWLWHPWNTVGTWCIDEALADGRALDEVRSPAGTDHTEINGATFMDGERILLNSSVDADEFEEEDGRVFHSGSLAVFNLASGRFESVTKVEETVGTMLWLGGGCVAGFYETPKVFDVQTGRVVARWPDLATGKQDSSIIHHLDPLPPVAIDPLRRRFAVAAAEGLVVIQF